MYTYKKTKIHTSNSPKKNSLIKKFASQTSNSSLKKKKNLNFNFVPQQKIRFVTSFLKKKSGMTLTTLLKFEYS